MKIVNRLPPVESLIPNVIFSLKIYRKNWLCGVIFTWFNNGTENTFDYEIPCRYHKQQKARVTVGEQHWKSTSLILS